MRVVLITQDDPFYLAENIDYLLENMPLGVQVSGCVVLEASPFGGKGGLLKKISNTLNVFGFWFFLRYSIRYLLRRLNSKLSVPGVLKKHNVEEVRLGSSINDPQSLDQIASKDPHLLISIAGNEIFKKPLIELAPMGCLNLHSSLLPKYRGLMPSFWVLHDREVETGVSVFYVDEGIDSGPIIIQKKIVIGDLSLEDLIVKSKRVGMDAVIEAVRSIMNGDVELIENNPDDMTYFTFPTSDNVKKFLLNGNRFF